MTRARQWTRRPSPSRPPTFARPVAALVVLVVLVVLTVASSLPLAGPARAQTLTTASTAEPRDSTEAIHLDIMGTVSVHAPDLSAFPRWRAALQAFDPWMERMRACGTRPCHDLGVVERVWLNRVQGLSHLGAVEMARAVDAFLTDLLDQTPRDHTVTHTGPWPTMQDVLAGKARTGLGIALSRYYTLRAAGMDSDTLRIMLARDTLTLDSTFVVLIETGQDRVAMTRYGAQVLVPNDSHAFIPVYAFNRNSRWLYFPEKSLDYIDP